MLRNHKIISFCIGLLFLVVVQKFATPEPIFRFLIPAFLIYSGLVIIYNRWYLKQIQKYNIWTLLRSFLLLCGGFGIFFITPSESVRGLFLIVTVALIAFFEMMLGNAAENILLNETLIIAFGLFLAFFGAFWYWPKYEPLYLLAIFSSTTLLTRSFYEFIPQSVKTKAIGSVAIGLFCSQLYWCLGFLQFHFSVLALILFNAFYFCLIVNYYFLFHILNFKKIQFHLLLMASCSAAILLTTRWSIMQ